MIAAPRRDFKNTQPVIETLEGRQLMSAAISGNVFNDSSVTGAFRRGDTELPGVRVYVDTSNAGAFRRGDPSALTDSRGNYTIPGLTPGFKTVREIVPLSFRQSFPINGGGHTLTLANASSHATGINFSDTQQARVTGLVYKDTDKSGNRQGSEPYLAGVTVFLDTNGNHILDPGELSTTTSSIGYFAFNNLTPNHTYSVLLDLPDSNSRMYPGWVQSQPATTLGYSTTLLSGQTFTGAVFGIHAPSGISYFAQTRSVTANADTVVVQTHMSNATGAFNSVANAATQGASAHAIVSSNITSGGITASGTLSGTAVNAAETEADSNITVDFTLPQATVFHLTYSVTGAGFFAYVEHLVGPNHDNGPYALGYYQADLNNPASSYSRTVGGTLAAGDYEFQFKNSFSSASIYKTTAWSVNFAV